MSSTEVLRLVFYESGLPEQLFTRSCKFKSKMFLKKLNSTNQTKPNKQRKKKKRCTQKSNKPLICLAGKWSVKGEFIYKIIVVSQLASSYW